MENRTRILIIEDESNIRRFVRLALENENYEVFEAEGVKRGLIEAATRRPELVVLDLGLPDGDGQEFITDLRTWSAIPVIVLSARSNENDKISALDAGADDYLVKPFGAGELLARVRAQLRRQQPVSQNEPFIRFSDVCIDPVRRIVELPSGSSDTDRIPDPDLYDIATRQGDYSPTAVKGHLGPRPHGRHALCQSAYGQSKKENRTERLNAQTPDYRSGNRIPFRFHPGLISCFQRF